MAAILVAIITLLIFRRMFPGLGIADWGLPLFAFVVASMGAYVSLKPPKEEYHWVWFGAFMVVGLILCGLSLKQISDSKIKDATNAKEAAEGQKKLLDEITTLKTVSPLRKQSFELADELNSFSARIERETAGWYQDKFKNKSYKQMQQVPGMTDEQIEQVFRAYRDGAKEYHSRFDARISSLLHQITTATGKDTSPILNKSNSISDSMTFKVTEVATDLSNLAGSLP